MPKPLRNFVDETGNRYGKLTVLRYEGRIDGYSTWRCQCDCNTERSVKVKQLRAGITRSCGCIRRWENPVGGHNKTLYMYTRSARRRGIEWRLSEAAFDELIASDCVYCDAPPGNIMKTGSKDRVREFRYTGIDRIDNSKGYVASNVVPCCIDCNRAKSDMSHAAFTTWLMHITQRTLSRLEATDADDAMLVD